jgi:putative phage-type endonuclease
MALTTEQLALRRTGITGTDISAILGLSKFRSAMDVYLDKVGEALPVVETEDMLRGQFLEDGLRRWYAAKVGAFHIREPGTVRHEDRPLIMATPDGLALFDRGPGEPERRALEIKAPGPYAEGGWGEPGTDEVPPAYLVQGIWEMAVLDVEQVDFAALLSGELRIYHVKRDRSLEADLFARAESWWMHHVVAGIQPEPSGSERDLRWIAERYPTHTKPPRAWDTLTPEKQALAHELRAAHAAHREAEARYNEAKARVQILVGEAGGLETPWGRIDWRQNKGTPVTDWQAIAEHLLFALAEDSWIIATEDGLPLFDLKDVAGFREDLVRLHTEVRPGARPFTPRFKKEEA